LKQYAGGYNSHCSLRHGPTHRASLQLAAAALLIMTNWTLPSSAAAEELEHSDHDPNTIALFVGAASEQRRQSGVAVGIEYERRLRPFFGLGALAEHTFGKIDTTVYAVPLALATGSDARARTAIMQLAAQRALAGRIPARRIYFGDREWDRAACDALGFEFIAVGDAVDFPRRIADYTRPERVLEMLALS